MDFCSSAYGSLVAELLSIDGDGYRLMPLSGGSRHPEGAAELINSPDLRKSLTQSRRPQETISGLWLYFSCLEESHHISQSANSREGAFWHGIMHRQEPDFWNAKYWFRQVGSHPIFSALHQEAIAITEKAHVSLKVPERWEPEWFVDVCEQAGSPSHSLHRVALEIQRAEWQLLFDYCASPATPTDRI